MNHNNCPSVRDGDVHEPQGNGYFRIMHYWYCEHGEIVANQFVDNYLVGNIAGAYREHWGKHNG